MEFDSAKDVPDGLELVAILLYGAVAGLN